MPSGRVASEMLVLEEIGMWHGHAEASFEGGWGPSSPLQGQRKKKNKEKKEKKEKKKEGNYKYRQITTYKVLFFPIFQ